MEEIDVRWRAPVDDDELSTLHARAFGASVVRRSWTAQLDEHSLGWVRGTDATGRLVGFANVAWDGGAHAFLLDVVVDPHLQRTGIATRIVDLAITETRSARCAWLHVDFEPHLRGFYLDACGFSPTDAGVIALDAER